MTNEEYSKLDSCHVSFDINDTCTEEIIDARLLLGSNRFDLYPILTYIDHKVSGVKNMTFAVNLYKERTRAVTNDKMSEEGNDNKNNFSDYICTLDALINDFVEGRYDINKTLVPVDKNYVLMDGAHRVSCAAYFGKKVRILRFLGKETYRINFQLLYQKFVPSIMLDFMALEAVKWHNDLFMLFLWPKSFEQPNVLRRGIDYIYEKTEVFYDKEAKMNYLSIRNLMLQIYAHMDWVGSAEDDFANVYAKADEVWSNKARCRLVLVKAPSKEYILNLKKEIREMFGVGLASIHSTDNINETTIAVNSLFNPVSMAFLKSAEPVKNKWTYKAFESSKNEMLNNKNIVVGADMALAIWGVYNTDKVCCLTGSPDFYKTPTNYFTFHNIKFLSPSNLVDYYQKEYDKTPNHKLKEKLRLAKSILGFQENNTLQKSVIMANLRRIKRKMKEQLILKSIGTLKILGIYPFLKKIKTLMSNHYNR